MVRDRTPHVKHRQRRPFDRIARIYDLVPVPTHPTRLRTAMPADARTVLDLGGGTGKYTGRIVPSPREAVVADASRPMLLRARRRNLPAVVATAERLPFRSAHFDAVLCTEAYHHFQDAEGALDEVARVLRPDGTFLLEEPDPTRVLGRWMRRAERLGRMGSTFRTPTQIAASLAARFEHVEHAPSGRLTVLFVAARPRPRPPETDRDR